MSKRGKKGSNKRQKNTGKSTKPHNAKQPRIEQPSTNQEHAIPPVQVTNPGPRRTETSYPDFELTTIQKSELLSRDLKPGESILKRYLAADPGASLRDLGAGPSTLLDPVVDEYIEEHDEGPLDLSIHSEEGPINLTKDSGASTSDRPREPEAGPSDRSRKPEADPSDWPSEPNAGPSNWLGETEAGSSNWHKDAEAGQSTLQSDSGAVPSTWVRDSGAGPSCSTDSGAGPSTPQGNNLQISSLDYDPYLKSSIVASFLGIPKCVRDAQEREAAELALAHDKRKYTTDEDSDDTECEHVPCDFKIPSSRLKRKISSEEQKPSTSKDDQVSSYFLDKPNGNQISQNSSSISEKAEQEAVKSPSGLESLVNSVQKFKMSTTDEKLDIRHVQDIEKEFLQMDIVRESDNLPDFGREYIQKLAASLLESDKPIVIDDYIPPIAWPRMKLRVPHVFLHPPFEFRNHMRNVLERNIQFYIPKRGTHYTKILNPSFEDQQNLTRYFDENGMPYHTFGHPSEKIMRVVIRGLTGDIDLGKLQEELIAASIPVVRLHKMQYNGIHKSPWHIILAIVPHNKEGLKLLKVRKIFGQDVTFERAKSKTKQCHRCQRWGHAQRFCRGRVRCVKCAGDHFSNQCTRDPKDEPPSCANCGGGHTASYRQCPHCPDSDVYKARQMRNIMRNITHNHQFSRVLATSENCDMLYDRN